MLNELQYVGNIDQLFKVREVELTQGRGKGVRVIEVDNNSGLYFEIAVDRGFDIPFLNYKGTNLGFISPCGISAPQYFDDKEDGFLKNFTAGFLTTCGLQSIGVPSSYQGKTYGLHGTYSNTPADTYSYRFDDDDEGPFVEFNSTVKEAAIFGDRLRLDRRIRCYYKSKKLSIDDVVQNEGFEKAIHSILYHMNIGYPLLAPESKLLINSEHITPRDEHAKNLMENWQQIEQPTANFKEACYYHQLHKNDKGDSVVGVFNPKLHKGVVITYSAKTLDHFVQWKMMGKGDYVLGLEPCNNRIEGVKNNADSNRLKYLNPGEKVSYHLEIEIVENYEDFEKLSK